jgi:indolepyruvate ferredoxin oxidoreductase alpha subunit
MAFQDVRVGVPGATVFFLGNEAIARGALEAGLDLVAGYPGTPSSEALDILYALAPEFGYIAEYSVNEKVAVEVAAGAAIVGKRALATMKHVGVNVAADTLFSLAQTGVTGAFVILSADDPGMHSSQNEQDNRLYGEHMHLPVLDPATPAEAKEFTKEAFRVSEQLELPVLLRTTTRVNHGSGLVPLAEIPQRAREKVCWTQHKNPQRFTMVPAFARARRKILTQKIEEARKLFENSELNPMTQTGGSVGILTSGIAYEYVLDALQALDLEDEVDVLKIGTAYPLPRETIAKFIRLLKALIVCEELEPYLEERAAAIAKDVNPKLRILGKRTGHLPYEFEYNTQIVIQGIAKALSLELPEEVSRGRAADGLDLPPRTPVFCPGCPHQASLYAIKQAVGEEAVFCGDIGCYTLGVQPPHSAIDTCLCMGASIGLAAGIQYFTDDPVVAVLGDSTFFHAGLPALASAVHNRANLTVVVLDNDTTAMTGHQPHPSALDHRMRRAERKLLQIAQAARGLGVEDVKTLGAFQVEELTEAVKESVAHRGVSVIVAKEPCSLNWDRRRRKAGQPIVAYTVTDACTGCLKCLRDFSCISLYEEHGFAHIDAALCNGCGVCATICPEDAIVQERRAGDLIQEIAHGS